MSTDRDRTFGETHAHGRAVTTLWSLKFKYQASIVVQAAQALLNPYCLNSNAPLDCLNVCCCETQRLSKLQQLIESMKFLHFRACLRDPAYKLGR
jgi:hypothetical protein